MAIETELKLRIAPGQLAKLKRHALLKAHQLTRPVTRRLYNIYFDTPKLELNQSAMALRLRRSGRQWLQTLKGGGSAQGGLHQRNEWEMPVSGPALDFSLPQVAEWDELLPKKLRKKLQPVFITDFSRNSRMLSWQGAEIELCMDQGEISTGHAHTPICELELELKSGEPRQLFELALAILDIVPFELESVSKAEQGFRLRSGYNEQSVTALPVVLHKYTDLSTAMQTLIWSCLQHFQDNLRGALGSGKNGEYVHQMRVALRRLRVLLRMAASVCADEQLAGFRKEVAALGIILGRIRDWDVFITQTIQPMCERMPAHRGLQALLGYSKEQRNGCYIQLRNDAQARDLQRLMLRIAIWMHGPYWPQAGDGLLTGDFAITYLNKLSRRFAQAGENLRTLDSVKLHAMRIQAKKLRYSAEFFASLYGHHKQKSYLAVLGEVQEVLGRINDVAAAHHLLEQMATITELSDYQEALMLAKGWIAHDVAQQIAELHDTIARFARLQPYWEK